MNEGMCKRKNFRMLSQVHGFFFFFFTLYPGVSVYYECCTDDVTGFTVCRLEGTERKT